MDFIQSAIEKARLERAQRLGERPGDPAGAAGEDPAAPAVTAAADRTALWTSLPEFGVNIRRLERNRVLAITGGGDAASFDIMRTKLLHQMRSNGWRRVAFTSPGSGCGKTMLTLNLALSMARQSDLAAMALELDMRRPTMARALGLTARHQVSEVLAGRAAAADHLARIGPNLAIGTNHRPEPAAAELLASKGAGQAVDRIEAEFAPDVMLFDLPPLLMTDDAMAFMDQIDCVLLVAEAERTVMAEITRCAEDLAARCNFLGVILNKCRFLATEERYGYGEGYGASD